MDPADALTLVVAAGERFLFDAADGGKIAEARTMNMLDGQPCRSYMYDKWSYDTLYDVLWRVMESTKGTHGTD